MLLTLTPVSQATYHFPLQAIKTGGMQWLSYSLEPKLFFSSKLQDKIQDEKPGFKAG